MHTELEMNGIAWSIQQIKAAFAMNRVVHCERQSGKTTALLEWVHDLVQKYPERIGFITHDWNTSRRMESEYNLRWPDYRYVSRNMAMPPPSDVLFIPGHELKRLYGQTRRVVVDEWWLLRDEDRRKLSQKFEVMAAVGTIRSYSSVPLF